MNAKEVSCKVVYDPSDFRELLDSLPGGEEIIIYYPDKVIWGIGGYSTPKVVPSKEFPGEDDLQVGLVFTDGPHYLCWTLYCIGEQGSLFLGVYETVAE